VSVYFIKLLSKLKDTKTQIFFLLLGPKPLPLGEENPCKIILIDISLTNAKTMTLDTIYLSMTKTSILFFIVVEIIILAAPLPH